MIKTIRQVGNSQGVIFDAALIEHAQPHPRAITASAGPFCSVPFPANFDKHCPCSCSLTKAATITATRLTSF
jgi:hypothetical protein